MKKLIIFLMLLFPVFAYAGGVCMMGGGVSSAGGCSGNYGYTTATNELNFNPRGSMLVKLTTLDCDDTSGTIKATLKNVHTSSYKVIFAIYSDSGGEPSSRLWDSVTDGDGAVYDVATDGVFATVSDNFTLNLSNGTTYWIGMVGQSAASWYKYTPSSADSRYKNLASFAWPDTWDTAGDTHSTASRAIWLGF